MRRTQKDEYQASEMNPLQPVTIKEIFGEDFDFNQNLTTQVAAEMMGKMTNFIIRKVAAPAQAQALPQVAIVEESPLEAIWKSRQFKKKVETLMKRVFGLQDPFLRTLETWMDENLEEGDRLTRQGLSSKVYSYFHHQDLCAIRTKEIKFRFEMLQIATEHMWRILSSRTTPM